MGRRRESFFGCAVFLASDQQAWLVLFVGISVPGKTPAVFVSEVTNPAEMQGRTLQPIEPLIAGLARRRGTAERYIWFGVRVDVAESSTEAHVDSSELSSVVLVSVIENVAAYALLRQVGCSSRQCGGYRPTWALVLLHHSVHGPGFRKRFAHHSTERSHREP